MIYLINRDCNFHIQKHVVAGSWNPGIYSMLYSPERNFGNYQTLGIIRLYVNMWIRGKRGNKDYTPTSVIAGCREENEMFRSVITIKHVAFHTAHCPNITIKFNTTKSVINVLVARLFSWMCDNYNQYDEHWTVNNISWKNNRNKHRRTHLAGVHILIYILIKTVFLILIMF